MLQQDNYSFAEKLGYVTLQELQHTVQTMYRTTRPALVKKAQF